MTQRTFNVVAGVIFTLVAVLHALRLLLGWEAVIGGWDVPRWVSWIALALAGYLAYSAFTVKKG
jgi:hypothetical protein